jgi:hypothetical protein
LRSCFSRDNTAGIRFVTRLPIPVFELGVYPAFLIRSQPPLPPALRGRSVYGLEESINGYGNTIYVEEWQNEKDRIPKIWYEFTRQGILVKRVREPLLIRATNLGKMKYRR